MRDTTANYNPHCDFSITSGDDPKDISVQIAYLLSKRLPTETISHEPMSWEKVKIGGQKHNKKRYKIAKKSRKSNRK